MVLLMSLSFVQAIVIGLFSCHFFATLFQTQFICLDRLAVFVVTVNGNLQLMALIEQIRNTLVVGLFIQFEFD